MMFKMHRAVMVLSMLALMPASYADWSLPRPANLGWFDKMLLVFFAAQLLHVPARGIKNYYRSVVTPRAKVGLITISGEIKEGERVVTALKDLMGRSDIRAVVLKVDSPGGLPGAAQSMYDAIRTLSRKYDKPVIAWVENMAASAAYYIASAADYIICSPSALVGSVGVIMMFPYIADFLEQFKARYIVLHAGKYKASGSPFIDLTAEAREMLEINMRETHERFKRDVLAARPQLLDKEPTLWAEGQPINGERALELGLVDALGSQLTVEEYIKMRLNVTQEVEWVKPPKKSALSRLLGDDESTDEHPYMQALVNCICTRLGLSNSLSRVIL